MATISAADFSNGFASLEGVVYPQDILELPDFAMRGINEEQVLLNYYKYGFCVRPNESDEAIALKYELYMKQYRAERAIYHRLNLKWAGKFGAFVNRYASYIITKNSRSPPKTAYGRMFANAVRTLYWEKVAESNRAKARAVAKRRERINKNAFWVLPVEELPDTNYSYEDGPTAKTRKVRVPVKEDERVYLTCQNPNPPKLVELKRDQPWQKELLAKLRLKILLCRLKRSSAHIKFYLRDYHFRLIAKYLQPFHHAAINEGPVFSCCKKAENNALIAEEATERYGDFSDIVEVATPEEAAAAEGVARAVNQNDTGPHETSPDAEVMEDMAGNVCMMSQRDQSVARIQPVIVPPTISMGDYNGEYSHLMDRWIQLETFEWTSTQGSNSIIKEYSLPSALLDKKPNSPNAILIKNFMYMRPENIEFKVIVNANKFQLGQLQVAWLYDTLADANISMRKHVCTFSQAMHALVNAGSSNEAVLTIPYINPVTSLPIVQRDDDTLCLHLGSVYITVINSLRQSSATNNKCNVSTYIKFSQVHFAGMKDHTFGTYAKPQMETAMAAMVLTGAAERLLNNSQGGPNQDNPSYVGARMSMVPQAMQSIAAGTNAVEVINHLRLDPRGSTGHFTADKQTISEVAQLYGLVGIHKWKTSDVAGSILFSYDASPMFHPAEYYSVIKQSNPCYYIPPVAVISALFAQWRGCLKMRVDFVKNQFYTGRLLVSYIPRLCTEPTLEQAMASPNMIFDLQEKDIFEFNVPFITNRFAWPRRQGVIGMDDRVDPPGRVYVFVLHGLTIMDSVPDYIEMNIYWAAGDSFEVGIPAQPSIGTMFWTTDDNPAKEMKAYAGYYPWYWGHYDDFYGGKKVIARYGPVWQHVAQFQNTSPKVYYTLTTQEAKKVPQMKKYDGTMFTPQYFVSIDLPDSQQGTWRYLSIVVNQDDAIKYARAPADAKPFQLCMDVADDDSGAYCTGNPVFTVNQVVDLSEFEVLDADNQSDERMHAEVSCTLLPCPSPSQGNKIWGENFVSLKDLCRRYQPYTSWVGKIAKGSLGDVTFSFPVLPQGLDLSIEELEKKKNYYQKFIRDGTIPIVASGFRFFRGSLRFQMIVHPQKNLNVWVQHRPDFVSKKWAVATAPTQPTSAEHYINTGYAAYIQTTRVNNVISFEVPYYMPYATTYLQRSDVARPHAQRATGLGTIYVGIEGADDVQVSVALLYSYGDDTQMQVFQGFPPMLLLDTVPKTLHRAVNQIKHTLTLTDAANVNISQTEPLDVHMSHVLSLPSSVDGFLNMLSTMWNSNEVETRKAEITNKIATVASSAQGIIIDVICAIGQFILNPTIKSLALSIVALLIKLGLVALSLTSKVAESLIRFFNSIGLKTEAESSTPPDQTTAREPTIHLATNQGPLDTEESIQLVSTLFTAVSQVCDVCIEPPKSLKGWAKVLTKDLTTNCKSGMFLQQFLKNNIALFDKICHYFTSYINKDKMLEQLSECDLIPLVKWCEEAEHLLDPKFSERIFAMDSSWADRLEEVYVVGGTIYKRFVDYHKRDDKHIARAFTAFNNLYHRVVKARDNMLKRGYGTVSRREPFCLWLYGQPGVGKSVCVQQLVPNLLTEAGIRYEGEPIFTLPGGARYWTGCRQQPCILMDDFLCVQTGEMMSDAVRDFIAIKSPSTLNPPQAHLEDKEARYAPELLVVTSNEIFPKLNQTHDDAIWRRREMLVEVELIPQLKDKLVNMNADNMKDVTRELGIDVSKYQHLVFKILKSPFDPMRRQDYREMHWEGFRKLVAKNFITYRNDQLELYNRRLDDYTHIARQLDDGGVKSLKQVKEDYQRLCQVLRLGASIRGIPFPTMLRIAEQYSNKEIDEVKMRELLRAHTEIMNQPPGHAVNQVGALVPLFWLTGDPAKFEEETRIVKEKLELASLKAEKWEELGIDIEEFKCKKCKRELLNCQCITEWVSRLNDHRLWKVLHQHGKEMNISKILTYAIKVPTLTDCPHTWQVGLARYERVDGKGSFYDDQNKLVAKDEDCEIATCNRKSKDIWGVIMRRWGIENSYMIDSRDDMNTPDYWAEVFKQSRTAGAAHGISTTSPTATTVVSNIQASTAWDRTKTFLMRHMSAIWQKFYAVAKWLGPLLGIIGLIAGVTCLVKGPKEAVDTAVDVSAAMAARGVCAFVERKVIGPRDTTINVQVTPSNENKTYDGTTTKHVPRGAKPSIHKFVSAATQSGNFNQHQDAVLTRICANTIFMTYTKDNQASAPMRALVIGENYVLMPWHYYTSLQSFNVDTVNITSPVNSQLNLIVKVKNLDPQQAENRDLCLVQIPNLPFFKRLTHWFATADTHTRPRGRCMIVEQTNGHLVRVHPVDVELNDVKVSGSYEAELTNCYSYKWGGAGKCGSLIVNFNDSNHPILGMHVAGNSLLGYAEPLFAEAVPSFRNIETSAGVVEADVQEDRLGGSYVPIGVVDAGLAHNQSSNTQHVPSLVHGIFPVVTEPAPLARGDPRVPIENYSPLWSGVANMTKPTGDFDQAEIDIVGDYMEEKLLSICKPVGSVGVRSCEEAVNGIPGCKYYDSIDMHTSEGFPLSRYRPEGAHNKSWLFGFSGNPPRATSINSHLMGIIHSKQDLRQRGIIPMTIFDDCLKDARIPKSKIHIPGKTRIFSTSPVDYTIAIKQYFLDFQAAFKTHRLELNHAIGINPDGAEWRQLVTKLRSKGSKFVTGDYKNFGPSLNVRILLRVMRMILSWYRHNGAGKDNNVREILLLETIYAVHLTHDVVWRALAGLPSGCPLTVELNSLVNEFYIRLAWRQIMRESGLDNWAYAMMQDVFDTNVALVTYGDDLIMSVSDLYIELFNNKSLQNYFSKFNIVFTDASKSGNNAYEEKLSSCTFLKRSFTPHPKFPNEFLASLDEDVSVKEVANWIIKSQDEKAATEESISAANLNAYTLGEMRFNEIRNVLQGALRTIGSNMVLRKWEDIDRLRFPEYYLQ